MKHVFLVNSNLHLRNCIATVKLLNLKYESVVFIARRKLQIPVPFKTLELNEDLRWKFLPYNSPVKLILTIFWISIYVKPLIQRKINITLQNDEFYLYLPHAFAVDIRILMRHEKCIGLRVVDEGTNGFSINNAKVPLNGIEKKRYFKSLITLLGLKFEATRELMPNCNHINKVFSPHPKAFKIYAKSKLSQLPITLVFPEIKKVGQRKLDEDIQLLLIDPFVHENRVDIETYKDKLKAMLTKIKEDFNPKSIHVSFHPTIRHDQKFTHDISKIISDMNIDPTVFEEDVEELFLRSSGILFCTYSSTMIWANKFGWRVVSWLNLLPNELHSKIEQTNNVLAYLKMCEVELLEGI